MTFFAKLLLGNGTLRPKTRAALESEGLLLVEEGLPGSIRYRHFKSPGRRFHGKVTPQRFGLGISEQRLSIYCRSGRTRLIDSPFSDPRWDAVEITLDDHDAVSIEIDYDRVDVPNVSGQITITMRTPTAATITELLQARLGRR